MSGSGGCERCIVGSVVHAVAVAEDDDPSDATIQLWCDDCVEGVVHGLDDPELARRYRGHRPLPVTVRA